MRRGQEVGPRRRQHHRGKNRIWWIAFVSACRLTVDLGMSGEASEFRLEAQPLEIDVGGDPVVVGQVLCGDRACWDLERMPRMLPVPARVHVMAGARTSAGLLFATEEGLLQCGAGGCVEPAEADGMATLGLTPLGGGAFLFTMTGGVGVWEDGKVSRVLTGANFSSDAPIAGNTHVDTWLRLTRAPYACVLSHAPSASDTTLGCAGVAGLHAPVSQAITLSDGRVAVATLGGGAAIFDGDAGGAIGDLPSEHVLDLVEWQGALWLATDRGLARYSDGLTERPNPKGLGELAQGRVSALAVLGDGSLAAYADRLYRVRQAPARAFPTK